MINKVIEYIDNHNMIKNGDKVIVALSGGPDSMCLMHMLYQLKEKYNLSLYAAHVNHCLRGDEADADESYVREYCEKYHIEFSSKRINILELAKDRGISSETAGREARYDYFEELRHRLKANKIALAHNLNDQAETILMRIIRGTGIEGLNGIKPVRDGIFIRPILGLSRHEIELYCESFNLRPRIDKTNLENIYNRNKVRLELIPYIQENFNKDIISTINRFSYIMSKDNECLEAIATEKYSLFCKKEDGKVSIDKTLLKEKEAMVSRIIRKVIDMLTGSLDNIEMKHIYEVIELFSMGTGKLINLPRDIIAENIYGNVHIYVNSFMKEIPAKNQEVTIPVSSINQCGNNELKYKIKDNVVIKLEVVDNNKCLNFGEDELTKYFDYDKIKDTIVHRFRREGDRFNPFGMTGSKKLKDLFIDLKIPKHKRDKISIICFDNKIAWIVGYRVSRDFIITKDTKKILKVKILKGEK